MHIDFMSNSFLMRQQKINSFIHPDSNWSIYIYPVQFSQQITGNVAKIETDQIHLGQGSK